MTIEPKITPGKNNLPRLLIDTAAAKAEIYLHGAQITSWQPAGAEEVIFLSEQSQWQDGKAIRGFVGGDRNVFAHKLICQGPLQRVDFDSSSTQPRCVTSEWSAAPTLRSWLL